MVHAVSHFVDCCKSIHLSATRIPLDGPSRLTAVCHATHSVYPEYAYPEMSIVRYDALSGTPWYDPMSGAVLLFLHWVFMWEVVCGCTVTTTKDGMSPYSLVIYMVLES